jgi:hypothetical protein
MITGFKNKAVFIIGAMFMLLFALIINQRWSKKQNLDNTVSPMVFDHEKWKEHNGHKYPYREKMYRDVLYNDTIRDLSQTDIFKLLGEPDKIKENFYYYTIDHTGMGAWTLHSKTMVFKFNVDEKVEWIKVHE